MTIFIFTVIILRAYSIISLARILNTILCPSVVLYSMPKINHRLICKISEFTFYIELAICYCRYKLIAFVLC